MLIASAAISDQPQKAHQTWRAHVYRIAAGPLALTYRLPALGVLLLGPTAFPAGTHANRTTTGGAARFARLLRG